ncbi:uncharacterized protein LOC129743269 isoform X2 [Uranotaenia lowii]|uniref:uncharacterized protein LOC129743269 isoform X2 n=1 Tax=Uranotaenia lowii TaxID=190385 RepID=UPI00247A388D|nr:uncharacterized protein LOC129743269 isoform X2 [Uranotaenia lowii]
MRVYLWFLPSICFRWWIGKCEGSREKNIEFFLNKEITHFITDKDYGSSTSTHQNQPATNADLDGPCSTSSYPAHYSQQQQQPGTPTTPKTPLSHPYLHLQQYVNEASPSSPCIGAIGTGAPSAAGTTAGGRSSHKYHQQNSSSSLNSTPAKGGNFVGTSGAAPSESKGKPTQPRSRADAMLQRVRQQSQNPNSPTVVSHLFPASNGSHHPPSPCSPAPPVSIPPATVNAVSSNTFRFDRNSQSPAQLAKSWGKPIWTTEYAIKFLKKVIETCKSSGTNGTGIGATADPRGNESKHQSRKSANLQHLRGDFVKIESSQRQHRPAFQLFKRWPVLNLSARSSASPFESEKERDKPQAATAQDSVQQTAGVANKQQTIGIHTAQQESVPQKTVATGQTNVTTAYTTKPTPREQQQCGYCEICRIEYDVLDNHLKTEEHHSFVANDGNFTALDKLIREGEVDLQKFLTANEQFVKENLLDEHTVVNKSDQPEAREEEKQKDKENLKTVLEGALDQGETVSSESAAEQECKPDELHPNKDDQNAAEVPGVITTLQQVSKAIRTYSRKRKAKNTPGNTPDLSEQPIGSPTVSSPPAKRTYAGRKAAKRSATASPKASVAAEPEPISEPEPSGRQMFGRRSAIYHHPHNTLNHHNHQKVQKAKQQLLIDQQKYKEQKQRADAAAIVAEDDNDDDQSDHEYSSGSETVEPTPVAATNHPRQTKKLNKNEASSVDAMKVLNERDDKEKDRQSKRSAADRMGLKGSSLKEVTNPTVADIVECDGLDPKNTKRISLGLRQNPKRANLNEDFTSLLDETLGPLKKQRRVRRESVKKVNYSEPREDDIVSQEEILESILETSAKEAGQPIKKKGGSPKRPLDVKIRGIQWRAPSPQDRPPIKSPMLYKVIEDPKPKNKKTASPSKDSNGAGSPSKSKKNGLIVKIRRVRQTELNLLNDEAENFMFPKKDDSSDEETDEDRQTSSETGPGEYSQEIPSSDVEHRNTSMRKSAGTPIPQASNRKRTPALAGSLPGPKSPQNQPTTSNEQVERSSTPLSSVSARGKRRGIRGLEAFLQDNAEYYKFTDPGSRLRFPDAPIQPNPELKSTADLAAEAAAADKGLMPPPPKRKSGWPRGKPRKSVQPEATVTTSDENQEDAGSASSSEQQDVTGYVLPAALGTVRGKEDGMGVFRWSSFINNCEKIEPYRFAFERVPSLEPWFETFQRQDESTEKTYEYFGNTAYRKLPYEMGKLPGLQPNCCFLNYRQKSQTPEDPNPPSGSSKGASSKSKTDADAGDETDSVSSSKEILALPLKKRKLLLDADRPRKSPREHASTLAILSLLQQQQQHNRRRTLSGGSVPMVSTGNLPPPSPTPYSPKKEAIKQQQQEADSALGDEIRSSCGSDPITEKDVEMEESETTCKKIKFNPPTMVDPNFIDYKTMCQELDDFLNEQGADFPEEELIPSKPKLIVPLLGETPLPQDWSDIVQHCDKEPPLSVKSVARHECIVRKIMTYDRKPRPLGAITLKSFDVGIGLGTSLFKKARINRTGWPNVKKRIVTRKQQKMLKVVKTDGEMKTEAGADDGEGSRKSSTEDSMMSGVEKLKQEDEDDLEDDDDEFEDTMTMLDDDDQQTTIGGQPDNLLTDDEESDDAPKSAPADPPRTATPVPSKVVESIRAPSSSRSGLPSSKSEASISAAPESQAESNIEPSTSTASVTVPANSDDGQQNPPTTSGNVPGPGRSKPNQAEDDDKECDSISSRSIFVSDDCDTTSSTLINMCTEDPLGPGCTTPQPEETSENHRPASRARLNNTRSMNSAGAASSTDRKRLQPVVRIERLSCPSTMRTRSSSRTPVKRTYKRSIFTSALCNSAGKPHKKKRKYNRHKVNGNSGASSVGSSTPTTCSEDAVSSSLECEDSMAGEEQPSTPPRKSIKDRPPTPSPIKFSPRKLRKPRGRWYRER